MTGGAIQAESPPPSFSIRKLFGIRDFAVLYGTETQSIIGDQLARIALSVLVFQQTDSAAATALTYAATFLPAVLGGLVLSGLGDRASKRSVMVGCDLARAGLFAGMAVPGLHLGVIIGLLVVAVFLGPAFSASLVSHLADRLHHEEFRLANGVRMITNQGAQVLGFGIGGALVAAARPRGALVLDAATYLASAIVVAIGLRPHRAKADGPAVETTTRVRAEPAKLSILWRDPQLRTLIGLCWLAGFFVVPEGLAVPFGHETGASTGEVGLLFAAIPLGGVVGAALLVRTVPRRRRAGVAAWLSVLTGLPLLACAADVTWQMAVALWVLAGAFAAYQLEVTTLLTRRLPEQSRARLLGVVSAGLIGAQGVGLAVFGVLAQETSAQDAVAAAGGTGAVAAVVLYAGGRVSAPARHRRSSSPDEGLGEGWDARKPRKERPANASAEPEIE